jgi:CRISPR/Cas system-associated exonuclease Cas4 (RecB family)
VRSWRIEKPLITGREDLRIKDENGELIPVEVKGLSPQEWAKLNTVEDFLNSKKHYVRGYPTQLFVDMYPFAKEHGLFVLVNKLTGEIKPIDVYLDYEYGEQCLQKAERIYKALETDTPPDSCDDISVCENCNLQHICGQVKRVPADIELDDELENLINRKTELAAAKKEFDEVDKQIKSIVGEREKVVTGSYLVTRKAVTREAYTVEASTYHKINIKRL